MHFRSNGLGPTYKAPDLGMKVLKMLMGNLAWIFFGMKKKKKKEKEIEFLASLRFFDSSFFFFFLLLLFSFLDFLTIGIVSGSSSSRWV